MRRSLSHSRAFTLLELLLVLLILSLAAAVVTPQLRNYARGRELGNTATDLISLANYARTQAIAQGRQYRLNVDPQSRSFWLTVQDGATATDLKNEWGQRLSATEGVSLQANLPSHDDGSYIAFDPTGRCEPGTIRLTAENGSAETIGCLSATETFHVLEPQEVGQ